MKKTSSSKRLLSLMLCLCLLLGTMPAIAMAEGATTGYTVTVGDTVTSYTDIDDAVSAACAEEQATLKLYQDIPEGLCWFTGGNVTLDMNGHTIMSRFANYGSLTITDTAESKGTVENHSGAFIEYTSGKLVILDTVDYSRTTEGNSGWRILYDPNATEVITVGTTGSEDIVIPEGCSVLDDAGELVTDTIEIGSCVTLHAHEWMYVADLTAQRCSGCNATQDVPECEMRHSFDENGICTVCGTDKQYVMTLELSDTYSDGWNNCALQIYEGYTLLATVTMDNGGEGTWCGDYDADKLYRFCWVAGNYPAECSFKLFFGEDLVFEATTQDCSGYSDGQCVYFNCVHSYDGGVVTPPTCTADGYTTYTCTVCGESFTGDAVAATGHTYEDGVCTVCGEGRNANEIKWQITAGATAEDATTDLRLISFVDSLEDYSKVVFTVSFTDAEGNVQTAELKCTVAYVEIKAEGVSIGNAAGIFGEGAAYFVTYTIEGWQQRYYDTDITVNVTRYDLEGKAHSTATRVINISDAM